MRGATDQELRAEAVRSAAERWADGLVDLSRNNGLLWYRKPRTATLDLAGAAPEAAGQLLAGSRVRLRELYPDAEVYEKALSQARNLRKKILEFSEEQGIEVGHVACGFLRLDVAKIGGAVQAHPIRAPLLLQPVAIHARASGAGDLALEVYPPPELNPVLIYALDRVRGLQLDDELAVQLRGALDTFDDLRAKAKNVYQVLAAALQGHGQETEFDEQTVVGIFSFEKMAMVQDLRRSTELLAENDIIAALADHRPAIEALSAERQPAVRPDSISPNEELLVLDADASQHKAINAALSGKHVLIDGPPGTGKSQTITNIVVSLAAAGKRVLFVTEKRAAIEAVTDRLHGLELAHLVYDLHEAKSGRRNMLRKLAEDLESQTREAEPNVEDLHRRLLRWRSILVSHAAALHTVNEPWRISFYEAMCRLQEVSPGHSDDVRPRVSPVAAFSADTFDEAMVNLKDLVDKDGLSIRLRRSRWSRATVRNAAEVHGILGDLDEIMTSTFYETCRRLEDIAGAAGLRCPEHLDGWGTLLELVGDVEESMRRFGTDVFATDLRDLVYVTGDSAFRARNRRPLGFCQRSQLMRKARSMFADSAHDMRALHSGLAAVLRSELPDHGGAGSGHEGRRWEPGFQRWFYQCSVSGCGLPFRAGRTVMPLV